MNKRNRSGKLNIVEPWELGTEKAIGASLVDRYENNYLIFLHEPLLIKGKSIHYLIGELRGEKLIDLLSDQVHGIFSLNMVYSNEITRENFREYPIKDFRGNFLLGEIIV